ncbi:M56 family metallopeptidase [Dyella agri]|uniref:Peptidase M56 n=1 Tax=Dyella agri TaxID=1926869 RepID=A0ABW8KF34_9GAMM
MNSLESLAAGWAARGWLLLLAFTVAVLVVAALRKSCRHWFGAERAFQLWLLPPLALLASQLPHAVASSKPLPPLVYTITLAVGAAAPHADLPGSFDWRAGALLLWLAGCIVVLALAALVQQRYRRRLRGATPMSGIASGRPVLRAASVDTGPALVGAWRSRIVLPADFRERYNDTEQTLILAHEAAHARRGDGWWCLSAQMLAALFWCHPLAWWALAALRHDQELACDAAVLREHGAQRRSYANAMLKTQSAALALPVGCTWSPRHPLTERIAMLNQKPIPALRRRAGSVALMVVLGAVAGAAYAATVPPATKGSPMVTPDRYSLELTVSFDDNPVQHLKKMCLKPGEYTHINGVSTGVPPWSGRVALVPAAKGQIEVRTYLSGGSLDKAVAPIVRTMPGQEARIETGRRAEGGKGGFTGIKLAMTPNIGC